MALVNLGGPGFLYPGLPIYIGPFPTSGVPAFQTIIMDATGERVGLIGEVWFAGGPGTSKTFSSSGANIQWRSGSTTFADVGTTIRVGIQDVSTTVGPPAEPDGDWTGEPYDDLVGGTDTISSNAWQTTTISSGSRTLTHGDLIAVVFDMTSRGGTDTVPYASLQAYGAVNRPTIIHRTGGGWAAIGNSSVNLVLTCDDGTACVLYGSFPCSAVNTRTYNTGSTPDEYGVIITNTFPCSIDGLWGTVDGDNEFEINLYSDPLGTPALEKQVIIDPNQLTVATGRYMHALCGVESLSANTAYAVTFRPTTGSNISVYEIVVNTASHMNFWPGDGAVYKVTRSNNTGAFSGDTTARIICGYIINQLDNGAGGGGGARSSTFVV